MYLPSVEVSAVNVVPAKETGSSKVPLPVTRSGAATNLKPNFAYQFKLLGISDTASSERIGLTGRWWQQEWLGSTWNGGANLNTIQDTLKCPGHGLGGWEA